jgi:hypothetical protein
MNIQRIFPVMGAITLIAALACGQQSSVKVEGGEGEEQVSLVIENTLNGIGRMISASSERGDVDIRYDPNGVSYHIRSRDGASVQIDAGTGKYTINARNREGVSATVEHSLDAVGSIIKAARVGRQASLTATEREALNTVWQTQGLSQTQIESYSEILRNAEEIERYARQLERDAKEIERDMKQLEKQIEADARQIERDADRIQRQVESDARQIEQDADRIAREARQAADAYRPAGAQEALYTCGGRDELTLQGETIEADGIAIYADGSCDVVIINCEIYSSSVAIRGAGTADITIQNSRIEGVTAAVELSGNADVEASGSTFIGDIITSGNAELEDLGGNTIPRK